MRTDPESLKAEAGFECESNSDWQCKNVVSNEVEHGA
jgi:hypothetical protein